MVFAHRCHVPGHVPDVAGVVALARDANATALPRPSPARAIELSAVPLRLFRMSITPSARNHLNCKSAVNASAHM